MSTLPSVSYLEMRDEHENSEYNDGTNKSGNEQPSVDESSNFQSITIKETKEYGLGGKDLLSFWTDMKILKSPNTGIGDSGASGHCTAHGQGGTNVREGSTTTTGISGGVIKSSKEMNIPCTHCDKFGNWKKNRKFKDVSYLNYNLCSITKMLQQGWNMYGDEDGIVMHHDNDKI